jgi:GrpB protein
VGSRAAASDHGDPRGLRPFLAGPASGVGRRHPRRSRRRRAGHRPRRFHRSADLAAKDIVDIVLTVADPRQDETYIPALEAIGWQHVIREPSWHEHRALGRSEPRANLHVFGPDCPETIRLRMFRDWLRSNPDDRRRYENAKRAAIPAADTSWTTTPASKTPSARSTIACSARPAFCPETAHRQARAAGAGAPVHRGTGEPEADCRWDATHAIGLSVPPPDQISEPRPVAVRRGRRRSGAGGGRDRGRPWAMARSTRSSGSAIRRGWLPCARRWTERSLDSQPGVTAGQKDGRGPVDVSRRGCGV